MQMAEQHSNFMKYMLLFWESHQKQGHTLPVPKYLSQDNYYINLLQAAVSLPDFLLSALCSWDVDPVLFPNH